MQGKMKMMRYRDEPLALIHTNTQHHAQVTRKKVNHPLEDVE